MRIIFVCLVLMLAGCGPRVAPSAPEGAERKTLQAWSTVGWGCQAPPFRRHACGGVEEAPGEDRAKCYFFTRSSAAGEPWDFARVNGAYQLIGRWTETSLTHAEWLRQQNQPLCEGVDASAKYPVFEVDRYCIAPTHVERHLRLLAENAPPDAESTRRWLRDHQCQSSPSPSAKTETHTDVRAARRLDEFARHPGTVNVAPLLRDAHEVVFSADGSAAFARSSYGGWFLPGLDASRAQRLKARHFDLARLSADGQILATVDDLGQTHVFDDRGKRLWRGIRAPALVSTAGTQSLPSASFVGNTLHHFDGCQLHAFDDGFVQPARPVGPRACGITTISNDGKRFAWRKPADELSRISYAWADVSRRVDFYEISAGAVDKLHTVTGEIVHVSLDDSGKRACLVDARQRLSCILLDTGERQIVSDGPVLPPLAFDASGSRLIYAIGSQRFARKEFFLHDFQLSAARALLHTSAASLQFLPGGQRIIRFDGVSPEAPGAVVYDLEREQQLEIWPDGEVAGLTPVPGKSSQLVIGRERAKTRDLYLVTLPN